MLHLKTCCAGSILRLKVECSNPPSLADDARHFVLISFEPERHSFNSTHAICCQKLGTSENSAPFLPLQKSRVRFCLSPSQLSPVEPFRQTLSLLSRHLGEGRALATWSGASVRERKRAAGGPCTEAPLRRTRREGERDHTQPHLSPG